MHDETEPPVDVDPLERTLERVATALDVLADRPILTPAAPRTTAFIEMRGGRTKEVTVIGYIDDGDDGWHAVAWVDSRAVACNPSHPRFPMRVVELRTA
jgi:hypothetical protein